MNKTIYLRTDKTTRKDRDNEQIISYNNYSQKSSFNYKKH